MELVKVDQRDAKNTNIVFKDFVRFARRATHGIGQATEAEAKELLRKLTKAGHITSEQETFLMTSLLDRVKSSREKFEGQVASAIQTAAKKLVDLSSRELARIEKKIEELEKGIEKNSKTKK